MMISKISKIGWVFSLLLVLTACVNQHRPQVIGSFYPEEPKDHHKRVYVFVHGIGGDAFNTWYNDKSKKYFFDLISEDTDGAGKESDIFVFGYPSEIFDVHNTTISDVSDKLRDRLIYNRITDYNQIIFVSHSMGGLITVEYLLNNPEIFKKVPLALFFGTPFNGSSYANVGRQLTNNPNFDEMYIPERGINELLKGLKRRWQNQTEKSATSVRCAYEEDKAVTGNFIVNYLSATGICSVVNSSGIGADHSNMVKPESRNTDAYFFLASSVQSVPLPHDAIFTFPSVVAVGSVGNFAVSISDPKIKEVFVTYNTIKNNNNRKIWIKSDLTCDGTVVAKGFDEISLAGSTTGQLHVNSSPPVYAQNNNSCYFSTRIPDTGYSGWDFNTKVTLILDNGSTKEYFFDKGFLGKSKTEERRLLKF